MNGMPTKKLDEFGFWDAVDTIVDYHRQAAVAAFEEFKIGGEQMAKFQAAQAAREMVFALVDRLPEPAREDATEQIRRSLEIAYLSTLWFRPKPTP